MRKLIHVGMLVLLGWSLSGFRWVAPESPVHVVLSNPTLRDVVGGTMAATVNIPFPGNFVTSVAGNSVTFPAFNLNANRCEFSCDIATSDVGFQASAVIFMVGGYYTTTPVLELYSDGRLTASTTASQWSTSGSWTSFIASLQTICVDSTGKATTTPATLCSSNSCCLNWWGASCRACDGNGVCNGPTGGAPCQVPLVGDAETCYLQPECGRGSACPSWATDCSQSGVNGSQNNGGGNLHSLVARVTSSNNGSPLVVAAKESLYKVVMANSAASNCSGSFDGDCTLNGGTQCVCP